MDQNVNLFAFFYLLKIVRRVPTSLHCFLHTHSFYWLRALSPCARSAIGLPLAMATEGYPLVPMNSAPVIVLFYGSYLWSKYAPPATFNRHPNRSFPLMATALGRAVPTICVCSPPFNQLSSNLSHSCYISLKLLPKVTGCFSVNHDSIDSLSFLLDALLLVSMAPKHPLSFLPL